MKERPILFSGPLVRALLAGTKTQTRRLIKNAPACMLDGRAIPSLVEEYRRAWVSTCPYGQPGDRLWVRETFALSHRDPDDAREDLLPSDEDAWDPPVYRADGESQGGGWTRRVGGKDVPSSAPWRPSIHMPRWASRITLEVTSVRVERLQDITEADILAEGITVDLVAKWCNVPWSSMPTLHDAWQVAWDSINSKRAPWASSPWVWVVSFKRIEATRAA